MGVHSEQQLQSINMKSMILIAVFLAVASAAPQFFEEQRKPVLIVKQAQEHDTEQQKYSFSFEADNGIVVTRAETRKKSDPQSRTSAPFPAEVTLTWAKITTDTPSTGWPMRTDSKPPELICPLHHRCPPMSSSFSLT